MIPYKRFQLDNGLKLIVHRDEHTDIAAVNLMYDVGARDENPEMTGLAHLFEHLMFEGSKNVAVYDRELEVAGGENNAFTNNDITNYYVTLPAVNIETALWLESDRMKDLNLSQKKLDIQKNVVMEEFKERYLNQPYGDVWALTRELSYKKHPYRWPTIGKELSHIEKVQLDNAKRFYQKFYAPDNAVLAVASPLEEEKVFDLVKKWFGSVPPAPEHYQRSLPEEPAQQEPRTKEVEKDVPSSMIIRAYHIQGRQSDNYYIDDLISDVLGNGESSRLKNRLEKKKELFYQIDAWVSGDIEPGLLIIGGKLNDNISISQANEAIEEEVSDLMENEISDRELQKAKNKALIRLEEEKTGVLEKAMNLAFYELLGDAELFNIQAGKYKAITPPDVKRECMKIFSKKNCNTLFYKSANIN